MGLEERVKGADVVDPRKLPGNCTVRPGLRTTGRARLLAAKPGFFLSSQGPAGVPGNWLKLRRARLCFQLWASWAWIGWPWWRSAGKGWCTWGGPTG